MALAELDVRTDGKWQMLLQKRASGKDSFPGCYDTSSAGHIHAGDEPLDSALRELEEELGIKAEEVESVRWFDVDYVKKKIAPPRDELFCVPREGLDLVIGWIRSGGGRSGR